MTEEEVLKLLREVGAVITDSHIVYTSGKHGSAYVNKDAVYPHTQEVSKLCRSIAENFVAKDIEVVMAPALGGIILSQWTAHHLSQLARHEILGVYAEKEGESFALKRGYEKLVQGKKLLVVEDILTTGGSVKKVVELARSFGAEVRGVGVLCNRGGITAKDLEVPELFALVNISLDAWEATRCPRCAQGVPINTQVGKGREFSKQKGAL